MASQGEQKSELRRGDPSWSPNQGGHLARLNIMRVANVAARDGRRGIRTPDILRVRQALWTS